MFVGGDVRRWQANISNRCIVVPSVWLCGAEGETTVSCIGSESKIGERW